MSIKSTKSTREPRRGRTALQQNTAAAEHNTAVAQQNTADAENRTSLFEQHVTETLERFDQKLNSPILNGGFENLMTKVEKIEETQAQLHNAQEKMGAKVDSIHAAIYDPEKGLYSKVKDAIAWINRANWVIKGTVGLLAAGGLTGLGKVVYDLVTGHIHYTT